MPPSLSLPLSLFACVSLDFLSHLILTQLSPLLEWLHIGLLLSLSPSDEDDEDDEMYSHSHHRPPLTFSHLDFLSQLGRYSDDQ